VRRTTWLAIAITWLGLASPLLASDSGVTTVVLVRHADKNTHAPGGDAGLSAKGILRAQELARVLADTPLAGVYSTPFARARLTGEAVSRARGDSVRVYDPERLEALAERIRREDAGRTVLVIGHSDTLPQTFEALTGEKFPEKESIDYDKLYFVTLFPGSGHHLLILHYGARVN
jgi:broad specificity phosphatase PhoE